MNNEKITHIDLFSGIGGFALAADRVFGNIEHIFCDNEPFAQEVLRKHWPDAKIYSDIRSLTYADCQRHLHREPEKLSTKRPHKALGKSLASTESPFILTGGFPCQPFSQAGRRRGEEDDRFLWPEMLRVIQEFSPLWVIAENVRGLLTQGGGVVFERVCTDLEAAGYEVQPIIIPAVSVGAPHRRDRVWFVAHRNDERRDNGEYHQPERHFLSDKGTAEEDKPQRKGRERGVGEIGTDAPDTRRGDGNEGSEGVRPEGIQRKSENSERFSHRDEWRKNWLEVATRLCRVDDGLPRRMDRNPRLKALGNAIVPQVAEEIMRAIMSSRPTRRKGEKGGQ